MGGGGGNGSFPNTIGGSRPTYPGNDPKKPPGEDFEWRGRGEPGSGKGSWYNPKTGERWFPDLNHPSPIGPHWDYIDRYGNKFRVFPDGRIEPK